MEHVRVQLGGDEFHLLRTGEGPPLLLLHGWPEFSLTFEPLMQRLAGRFTLIAPDLRGFGDSAKPERPWGPADHTRDMLALLDALGLDRVGVIGHDVGGAVMQPLARAAPDRLRGLFFFSFVHPGIGARAVAPDRLNEIWYQSFHQMPFAPALVGATRESCRLYLRHFLWHWSHRKDVWTPEVVEQFVDNFMKPGNLAGGFSHYIANHAGRIAMAKGEAPNLAPIALPTCVRWGAADPILLCEWMDTLGQTFTSLDAAPFPGVGHFPHREDPDRAAHEIATFFGTLT